MSKLLELFKKSKIDFSKIKLIKSSNGFEVDFFDVKPKDFIRYSKDDFNSKNQKGLINSITNTKRGIDCQIDTILVNFGISYDKINKSSEDLINYLNIQTSDLPHKLKLVQALKFAPSGLITTTRNLRNKLEHYYQIPTQNEVSNSMEIAELFILSCESKTKDVINEFVLTNKAYSYIYPPKKTTKPGDIEYVYMTLYSNNIEFYFDNKSKEFIVTITINEEDEESIRFTQVNPEYYFLLRLMNSMDDDIDFIESFSILLDYLKHPIPSKNIKLES